MYFVPSSVAPSAPRNIIVSPINATAVEVIWDEPSMPNGIIRRYIITSPFSPAITTSHNDSLSLIVTFYELTPSTNYTVNISAVTVEPGDVASLSFTTPSCKCVIVLMCYVMYCSD